MGDSFKDFSDALRTRLKADPHLRLQMAHNLHASFTNQGLKSPGVKAILQRMKATTGDDTGGGGGGGGSGGAPIRPITVEAFIWGFHLVIPEQPLQDILVAGDAASEFASLLGPETGPAAPFMEALSIVLSSLLGLMQAVDKGKGVYLSMAWILPGVFIPTTI